MDRGARFRGTEVHDDFHDFLMKLVSRGTSLRCEDATALVATARLSGILGVMIIYVILSFDGNAVSITN